MELLALRRLLVAGLEPRLHRADLLPERLHVDDEVLDDRQVAHRRDHRHVPGLRRSSYMRVLQASTARAVHAHPARAADHHPAALAVRERAVDLVLDDVEDVEQRRPLGRLDLVLLQLALAGPAVVAPDLERDVHRRRAGRRSDCGVSHRQYVLSCGCHFVIVTGFQSSAGLPSAQRDHRVPEEVLVVAVRDSRTAARARRGSPSARGPATTMHCGELEQEAELERLRQVAVEDVALVLDDDALVALAQRLRRSRPARCIWSSRRKTPKFSCIVSASSSRIRHGRSPSARSSSAFSSRSASRHGRLRDGRRSCARAPTRRRAARRACRR